MGNTNDSKKIIKAEYTESKKIVEENLELEEEKDIKIDKEKLKKLKNSLEGNVKIYLQYSIEGFSTTKERKDIELKIRNQLLRLDNVYDIFVKSRKKALKLLSMQNDDVYLSSIDRYVFDDCIKESLKQFITEYKQKNKITSFLAIFEKYYYLKLELLVKTKIKEIREKKIQLEEKVRIYVQGIADRILNNTKKVELQLDIFKILISLDKDYDVFAKQRLGALKRLNYYNKRLTFYEAGADKYVKLVKEILNDNIEKYKETGRIGSFIAEFSKQYFNYMLKVVVASLKEENSQYYLQIKIAKEEVKTLYKELFENDKEFFKEVIKNLNEKKVFNYHTIKYSLLKNILSYIDLLDEDKIINSDIYNYIRKEEFSKGTSRDEVDYIIKAKSKQDLEALKENVRSIINNFYKIDYSSSNDKDVNRSIKNKNALEKQLKNMKGIDINKIKNIEIKLPRIEGCLVRIKNILKEKIIINILQINEEEKEYSILERRALRQPSFEIVKEKFFTYIDIYEKIKDKLSKSSQTFFEYIFKYIVLDFKRRGHEDVELYDYVKDDIEFIAFYNKNIPDMENPNYIDKATDKKYVLEPNEKIVHKAIAFITDYLNIKYDTGRKRRKEILKDVYATVKEENTGLRYFRRFLEEDL